MQKPRKGLGLLVSALGTVTLAGCTGGAPPASGAAGTPSPASSTTPGSQRSALAVSTALPTFEPYIARTDEQLGGPTMVYFTTSGAIPASARAEDVAQAAVRSMAQKARISEGAYAALSLYDVHKGGSGTIAQFRQAVDGVEVFRANLAVALNRRGEPVLASGFVATSAKATTKDFGLSEASAVAAAFAAETKQELSASRVVAAATPVDSAGYRQFDLPAVGTYRAATPARARKVWWPKPGVLAPAYYVELDLSADAKPDSQMTAHVVDAQSGEVLFRHDLTASDSYRVYGDKTTPFQPLDSAQGTSFTPHPTGKADGTDPAYSQAELVTLQNAPFSKNDPWLPANSQELDGNNTRAYADLEAPDGYAANTKDLLVPPTAAGVWDRTYDPSTKPQATAESIRAITTHLFYNINYMHDFFYDAGWNEASRNPQKSNFGRGGAEADPIKSESQDYSGRNNANASTPADGRSPRIQMYLWDSNNGLRTFTVNSPASVAGNYKYVGAAFGPSVFDRTGDLVAAVDSSMNPTQACNALTNAAQVAGKIALIDRGTCAFQQKAANAQAAGAIGVVIANNAAGLPPTLGAQTGQPAINIPTVGISQEDGAKIRAALMNGAVNTRVAQDPVDRDGSLDTTIVSHEWGHILSNRLIGNGSGLTTQQAAGMGEGWSDFVSLLTVTRADDANVPANKDWAGVYAVGAFAVSAPGEDAHYYGIRRYPYSTDLTKNPMTFKHTVNGTALPMTPAPRFGADGASNAEVHNTGEVWTTMLWECYVNLLKSTDRFTFAQANQRMRDGLVAGMKLTPVGPTILAARDALLSAMLMTDSKDFSACYQGFAKRGAGVGAVGAPANSASNGPVTESFAFGTDPGIVEVTLDDSVKNCDMDGILDNGETGKLTIKVRNTGAAPATQAKLQVTSSDPSVTLANGGMVMVPRIEPYQTVTVTLEASMKNAMPQQAFKLTVKITDPDLAQMRDISKAIDFVGNYDEAKDGATSDDFSTKANVWSAGGDAMLDQSKPWARVQNGAKGVYQAPGNEAESDQYLVSPVLAPGTEAFGFTLTHRYSFETAQGQNADGGVIEYSVDGGKTWQDVGTALKSGGYGGMLYNMNKPLSGRSAFVGNSTNYAMGATVDSKVDFGTTLSGKMVQLRFRVGTDLGTALPGWEIAKVVFTGLSNKPFPTRTADKGLCANRPPVADAGMDQKVTPGSTVQLMGVGTDPDMDPLTFRWTQAEGAMVMLADDKNAQTTFVAPDVKEATTIKLTLVANDGKVDSAPSTVTITVDPAASPMPKPDNGGCSCQVPGGQSPGGANGGLALLAIAGLAAMLRRRIRA